MWSGAARSGGRIGLSKLGSAGSWRGLAAGASPLGEGGLDFQTKRFPSFWNRLKQQKQGLGSMALSASVAFLAISIIKQEKELTRANESADRLKQQNEALKERLDGLRSVLLKSVTDEKMDSDVLTLLRDAIDLNGGGHVDPHVEIGNFLTLRPITLPIGSRKKDIAAVLQPPLLYVHFVGGG